MIKIAGKTVEPGTITDQIPGNGIEDKIVEMMARSSEEYRYDSIEQLRFELEFRKSIINAAKELARSNFSFTVFRKSRSNPEFWHRTEEGGFMLQPDVTPYDAINDIYENSSMYGNECATAMVIVYYKALADILPKELFNQLFPEIYLMNWQHLDRDLGITTINNPADSLPGDAKYFKNPDVDPLFPEWQGENVFDLGNGQYYGHGIGITNADTIIRALNSKRVEGSDRSAYLMDKAERPDFKHLADKLAAYNARSSAQAYL